MIMISKNKKGGMTMDKLAQITAGGFSKVDKRFEKIDERFEKVDERFEKIDKRFDRVENSITDLRGEFNGLKSEVNDKIDNGINKMLVIADGMAKQFSDWKQENAFGAGIESRQDEQLKNHEVRIKKLETV